MPFKSPCQPYRLFSSFKQKYISFEIFSPQLLLTKTKTKKQRLPASESDLSSSDTLSSSGDPQVGGGLLERNASALIFFSLSESAKRRGVGVPLLFGSFRSSCSWTDVRRWATVCSLATTILRKIVVRTPMTMETLQPPKTAERTHLRIIEHARWASASYKWGYSPI